MFGLIRRITLALCLVSAAAPASAQTQTPAPIPVAGVVLDQTGGVLPHAQVELLNSAGVAIASTITDGTGQFHFDHVAAGQYELRASMAGFEPVHTRLRIGTRSSGPQKLVLPLASVKEAVSVDSGAGTVDTSASNNLNAISIDRQMLQSLPAMDLDYIGVISRFLDAGSVGSGGPTLIVNGMEVNALRVSPSAVQQIKVNQDPYSAEYGRPGRGRIEILTKPGGQEYSAEVNAVLRDAHLDAQNAFAAAKPAERKDIFEGNVSGPLGHSGKTSFLISAEHQTDDQQAIVYALGPSGTLRDLVQQPNTQALLSGSITHQVSDHTIVSITPSYEYERNENRGVGGVTLASAGTTFTHHEQQLRYTQQSSLRPTLINQFQILVGHEREPTVGASDAVGLVVADAFTGGGAQSDLIRTELHTQMNESLTWGKGRHSVQGGVQLPDWSRRGFQDRTNFGGTYYFAGLDAYAAGQPYAFTEQQGNGNLTLLEKQVGVYIKDDWQVRPRFSLSAGVRYDWQNYFHDDNNVDPRVSFAYAIASARKNVIRGGAGIFTDRSGPVILAELLHSRAGDLQRYVVTNPSYPDPPALAGAAQPRSITVLAPDVQIPQTVQYSLGLDHQLRKSLTMSVTFLGARGYNMFRSRDVNAPPPPLYTDRPNPAYGAIRQIESSGRQSSDSLQLTLRGQMTRWFNGQTQYTLARVWNDTNGLGYYPANDYDLSGEWARADADRRHRLALLGQITALHFANIGVGLTMNSAGPYTELLGADVYNNGRGRARPAGVARNTLTGAGFAQLDLRVSHDVKLAHRKGAPAMSLSIDAFNVLNRVNYGTFVGTIDSSRFGQPISARPPRQVQLSLGFSY